VNDLDSADGVLGRGKSGNGQNGGGVIVEKTPESRWAVVTVRSLAGETFRQEHASGEKPQSTKRRGSKRGEDNVQGGGDRQGP